jgi:hypothetical protein
MSAGPDLDSRAAAPDRTTDGANFVVEPHEQIYRQAMERFAAIGEEWAATVRGFGAREA